MQLNQLLGDIGNLNVGKENQNPTYAANRDQSYGNSSNFMNGYPRSSWAITMKSGVERITQIRVSSHPSLLPTAEHGLWYLIQIITGVYLLPDIIPILQATAMHGLVTIVPTTLQLELHPHTSVYLHVPVTMVELRLDKQPYWNVDCEAFSRNSKDT